MKLRKIFWMQAVIFIAAFLLFQIELIMAKIFLPKFGGSYLVWGACIVFFQATLLLGYLYSHIVIKKFGLAKYRYVHLIVVFLPLLFFPARPLPALQTSVSMPMVIAVFWQLLVSVGPVFFVLSTTSIIFQGWLASSKMSERSNPYVLYAVSNLGSFAALLSYPFFFEAFFDLNTQIVIWRAAYLILLGLHLITLRLINVEELHAAPEKEKPHPVKMEDMSLWFLLSAASTVMFLAVTNIITYEATPIPLLWIIPLSIYLLSFTLNFKKSPWYPTWISRNFHIIAGFSIILFFLAQRRILPFMIVVIMDSFVLFLVCMFCNGELHRHKPADNRSLTLFYLIIASGGVIAGMVVTWIIPLVSMSMIEYLFGLFVISLALAMREKGLHVLDGYGIRLIGYILLLIILWPMIFRGYNFFGIFLLFWAFGVIYPNFKTRAGVFLLSMWAVICVTPFVDSAWEAHSYIYKHRNYYGIYKVYDEAGRRLLLNGTTLHGAQYLDEKRQMVPLTYFHPSTPMGRLMKSGLFNFSRVGIIGLGTGTLAAYNKPDGVMDFFELDPDVYDIANKYFTYLQKGPGKINFIFGDARVTLDNAPKGYYDILIVDAFSGDSVPIHLVTTEAISKYREHIKSNGVILFHVSSRYLDLPPVLFSNARALAAYACKNSNFPSANGDAYPSLCVAFTWDRASYEKLTSQLGWSGPNLKERENNLRPWSDQYHNVIPVILIDKLLSQIKEFKPFYWSFANTANRTTLERYYFTQGAACGDKGDFNEAVNYFNKAIEIIPNNPEAHANLGIAYGKLGQRQMAESNFLKAKELFKDRGDESSIKKIEDSLKALP